MSAADVYQVPATGRVPQRAWCVNILRLEQNAPEARNQNALRGNSPSNNLRSGKGLERFVGCSKVLGASLLSDTVAAEAAQIAELQKHCSYS